MSLHHRQHRQQEGQQDRPAGNPPADRRRAAHPTDPEVCPRAGRAALPQRRRHLRAALSRRRVVPARQLHGGAGPRPRGQPGGQSGPPARGRVAGGVDQALGDANGGDAAGGDGGGPGTHLEVDPHAAIFIESEPSTGLPYWSDSDLKEIVNANHWYDGVTLHTKNFNPNFTIDLDTIKLVFGKKAVFTLFKKQLKKIQDQSNDIPGGAPTLIGEFGIPFDMGHKKSYKNGDFSNQIRALNMYYQILDSLFLHSTIWNYTSDNTNERGDQWNDEDLSIFSKDQQHNPNDINSGGRALAAIIRPFCTSLSGEPLSQWFDLSKKEYYFGFSDQSGQTAEFFVPDFHYPRGVHIEVSDGEWNYDQNNQSLTFTPGINQSEHNVRILPK
ncbi:MAG: hypothetical protein HGB14_06765 [Anaerolineaceae bacterium]|nr:hypothetical protein [Anaerolineaceae bacterium]